jgi:hypothetical protein
MVMADREKQPTDAAWIKAGGIAIAHDAVLLDLKIGIDAGFLSALVRRKIAAAIAVKRGLSLADDEFEEALAAFHADRDLFEPEQVDQWYKSRHLEEQPVREYVSETALIDRAKQELITDEQIQKRFGADRYEYDVAEADVFGFKTVGEAREFMLAVREHELTPEGGVRERLTRREAPTEIAAVLLSAEPEELVGPVETDDGRYDVYMLHRREDATLDDSLTEEIRDKLFDELIELELMRDPLTFLV